MDYFYEWNPYVSVASRRLQATRALAKLRQNGSVPEPVQIEGRKIARTFWGKAWCENLERYSDFANRLPRGRSYVRNGSVLDLQIAAGAVTALVSGSEVYTIRIEVTAVPGSRWQDICGACSGAIDSLVELLQGRLSTPVITRLCEPKTGLFPEPREVSFRCSCPDWASMCKHVAAVLYGVAARLDQRPELLFLLRGVEQQDLIAKAGASLPSAKGSHGGKVLGAVDLSQMFDIDIAAGEAPPDAAAPRKTRGKRAASLAPPTPASLPAAKTARKSATKKKAPAPARKAKPAAAAAAARKPSVKAMTAKQRAAIVARMKKYWRERRRRAGR
jgi:uncharacterized Zn finger protein